MAPETVEEKEARPVSQDDASRSPSSENHGSTAQLDASRNSNSHSGSEDGEASEGEATGVNEGTSAVSTSNDEAPPLPSEEIPPLPAEAPPGTAEQDDGWEPVWDAGAQSFYFYNRLTGASQWDNPRVPQAAIATAAGVEPPAPIPAAAPPATSGYNPAIHGDYDPNAWYAQSSAPKAHDAQATLAPGQDAAAQYAATAAFNRFTGRYQNADLKPENFNDENKSKRQMSAFFDVDAAANSHDGKSLKAERSGKKLSKTELKQFKEKRKMKKEEKRRAWLRD